VREERHEADATRDNFFFAPSCPAFMQKYTEVTVCVSGTWVKNFFWRICWFACKLTCWLIINAHHRSIIRADWQKFFSCFQFEYSSRSGN
jgi:hypothetical protein